MARPYSRNDLKAIALWAARMLASEGGGTPFPGKVRLEIVKSDDSESVVVKPTKGIDGLSAPEQLRGDERIDATMSDLLQLFLSPDERSLLIELQAAGKATASAILERAKGKVSKSAFWELWGNLQQRGLVVQGNDELYRVGPVWVGQLLKAG
jgi:hypothetical protein